MKMNLIKAKNFNYEYKYVELYFIKMTTTGLEPAIYRLEVCRLIQFGHVVSQLMVIKTWIFFFIFFFIKIEYNMII